MAEACFKAGYPMGFGCGSGSTDANQTWGTTFGAFGADRLMFGSDWPVCTLAASYDEVLAAARELTGDLSAGERDAIFAGTASRVYRLQLG